MWLKLKNLILYFINKGTEHYDALEDKQRVRLINFSVLLLLIILLPNAIIKKVVGGNYLELVLPSMLFLLLLLVIFFNQRGKNQISSYIFIISPIVTSIIFVLKVDHQFALPYISLYVGIGAFYLIRDPLLKNLLAAMGFLSFAFTNYYQLNYLPFEKGEYFLVVLILILIYIGFKYFISELSNSRSQIIDYNKKLLELNREKDGMLGIVAHDLRSPFNHIKGLINLMGLGAITKSEQQDLVDRINYSIEQANLLISDLLDLNNFQQDVFKLKPGRINLSDFLLKLNANFKKLASEKQQRLNCIDTVKSEVITDEFLLTRIMENLLSNAIKFSPPKTSINVGINQEGDTFIISIKDEGPGFTEDDKAKVFGKFQKLSAKPTGGEGSTGLGLSIVKNLVDKLQGSVELISKRGQGSEFVIILHSIK